MKSKHINPFRPGAGHKPPYLAGRQEEKDQFARLLEQAVILENLVLTGLRGVGKTVLLEELKPMAQQAGWLWVGTDLSEAMSLTDERIADRLMVDLAPITSNLVIHHRQTESMGLRPQSDTEEVRLSYSVMRSIYDATPGVASDKLKAILELVWQELSRNQATRGVIFAYDEAQNLTDHSRDKEYPLSLMLDVFQSLQRKEIPVMLALVGLPTLFPKLVEARTYAERMFRVVVLDRLTDEACREAIVRPVKDAASKLNFTEPTIGLVVSESGGYPYFIQFICRELFDLFLQKLDAGERPEIPLESITRKLDSDFFAGRWARVTDRQRDLLLVIARLPSCEGEFGVQEIVEESKSRLDRPFSASHVNQLLAKLSEIGLIYKNRHGKYSFAVPLLNRYITRQMD